MIPGNNPNIIYTNIVCIASSTGGPAALLQILPKLDAGFPVPVVVVQHIWPGFTPMLSEDLDRKCKLHVCLAKDGMIPMPGNIYFAPAGKHVTIRKVFAHHIFVLSDDAPAGGVKPSADMLFRSLADCAYSRITAVVLTGMGSDATEGIRFLSEKKHVDIITQDEESCAVYGMPGSIKEHFPDCKVIRLSHIANELMKCQPV